LLETLFRTLVPVIVNPPAVKIPAPNAAEFAVTNDPVTVSFP